MDFTDIGRRLLLRAAAEIAARHYSIEVERAEKIIAYLIQFGHVTFSSLETITTNPRTVLDVIKAGLNSLRSFLGSAGFTLDIGQVERVMGYPRCGCPDVMPMRMEEARWRKNRLTYYIASWVNGLSQTDQSDLIAMAWKSWSDVADLGFTRVNSQTGADIVISTGRGRASNFDGPNGTLAWAYLPQGDDRQLLMRYDLDERWIKESGSPGILFLNVSAHEFGHAIGLDHSRVSSSLMAPYYSPPISKPQQNDDVTRIQALYGRPVTPPIDPPVVPPVGEWTRTCIIRGKGNVSDVSVTIA